MNNQIISEFSPEVCKKLEYYVYRLIDPRNGETFYVGKGKDNRIFQHLKQSLKFGENEDDVSEKYGRIQEIQKAGLSVIHIIHRHGMNETTAYEVEAALIEAYPGLTNLQNGYCNNERGSMHVIEIQKQYDAPIAEFDPNHKLLIININRSYGEQKSAYDAARLAWKLDKVRAEKADYILAVEKGLIVDVLKADKWLDATKENFPELAEDWQGRFGFKGYRISESEKNLRERYCGKKLPEEYRKRGASNPIKYSFK